MQDIHLYKELSNSIIAFLLFTQVKHQNTSRYELEWFKVVYQKQEEVKYPYTFFYSTMKLPSKLIINMYEHCLAQIHTDIYFQSPDRRMK